MNRDFKSARINSNKFILSSQNKSIKATLANHPGVQDDIYPSQEIIMAKFPNKNTTD